MPVKLYIYSGAVLACFSLGWYCHSVWDGYLGQKTENKAIASLGKGEVKIIKVHQELDHDKIFKADKCAGSTMPAGVLKLLK